MDYEWDPEKSLTNRYKHGISFADAVSAFSDEFALVTDDDYPTEERFRLLGMDAFGRLLVIIYTWRGLHRIRLISARIATRTERRQYEGDDDAR